MDQNWNQYVGPTGPVNTLQDTYVPDGAVLLDSESNLDIDTVSFTTIVKVKLTSLVLDVNHPEYQRVL